MRRLHDGRSRTDGGSRLVVSARRDTTRGAVYAIGAAAGYLPVAAAFGALAVKAGMNPWVAIASSAWLYAAAAQMIGLQSLATHGGVVFSSLGMVLVNLRYLPMSISARPVLGRLGRADQAALAFSLTDESYALDLAEPRQSAAFYRGVHALCWLAWLGGTCIGVSAGAVIPTSWTAFALPALFVALAVDTVRSFRPTLRPVLVAGAIAVVELCRLAGAVSDIAALIILSTALWAGGRRWTLFTPQPDTQGTEQPDTAEPDPPAGAADTALDPAAAPAASRSRA